MYYVQDQSICDLKPTLAILFQHDQILTFCLIDQVLINYKDFDFRIL